PGQDMSGQAHLDWSLAALCVLGGGVGWIKKKSLPSLAGGLVIGAAYGVSGYLIEQVDGFQGHVVGGVTSLVLAGMMGSRYARTKKMMPAGIMAAAGMLGLLYHGKKTMDWA
ncbi:hypothetical protein QJQ45_030293, partial [Haematococcus lacustris]